MELFTECVGCISSPKYKHENDKCDLLNVVKGLKYIMDYPSNSLPNLPRICGLRALKAWDLKAKKKARLASNYTELIKLFTVHGSPIFWELWYTKGWMDERCFRPLLCTVKAELGRGQPGLMR